MWRRRWWSQVKRPLVQWTGWWVLGSGSALGVAAVVSSPWLAVPLSVAGVVMSVQLLQAAQRLQSALLLLVGVWWVKSLYTLSWFWSVYPIDWLAPVPPPVQLGAIFLYWVTVALWLALGALALGGGWWWARTRPLGQQYALVPLWWVVAEWLGAWSFSVFTAGQGSVLGAQFGLGMVGYVLARTPLVLVATLGGVTTLGVLWLGGILGGLWWWQTGAYRRVVGLVVLSGVVVGGLWWWGSQSAVAGSLVTVASVNTQFRADTAATSEAFAARQAALEALVRVAATSEAAYLILPEDARLATTRGVAETPASLYFALGQPSQTIIDSSRVAFGEAAVLRGFVFTADQATVTTFDKNYLVPQGEYVPTLYSAALRLVGLGSVVANLERQSNYVPGVRQVSAVPGVPGILFCFESMKPGAARALAAVGVPFIAHPLSHAWFHSPQILWSQQDAMLRVQAVESGVSIVSASNLAPSRHYRPDGTTDAGVVATTTPAGEVRLFTVSLP